MEPTEPQYSTTTKLARIAWLSERDPLKKFDALMHLFNKESLTACFHELDGKKAVGYDKVSKDEYGEKLDENLEVLLEKMKKMAYRPGPVREVLIPKEGKAGSFRPLGIGNFEDKLVQKMTAKILESIFEPTFLDCSYGFRPGLGCHDAIRGLNGYLYTNKVETVIDVDLANFFGTIGRGLVNQVSRKINPLFDLFRLTPALFQFAASGFICSILRRLEAQKCGSCLFFRFSRKLFLV